MSLRFASTVSLPLHLLSRCRKDGRKVFAMTAPLVTTQDGRKMGKTEGGAVWLNREELSEFEYWQFWRNTADGDVGKFLRLFTEVGLDEIGRLEQLEGAGINEAKIVLADKATEMLHGPECLESVHAMAKKMFTQGAGAGAGSGGVDTSGLPSVEISGERAILR